MKKRRGTNYFMLLFCLLFVLNVFDGFSQIQQTEQREKLLQVSKEIMNSANTCALITLDDEGRPRVRAMSPFPPEEDFTVWFGTNTNSRKVAQIKNDSRVTLYYLDNDESGYVMMYGRAELVNENAEKEKRWKREWEAFYPENRENYLLIKVVPEWLEVSSAPRGIIGNTVTWQPPKVNMNAEKEIPK